MLSTDAETNRNAETDEFRGVEHAVVPITLLEAGDHEELSREILEGVPWANGTHILAGRARRDVETANIPEIHESAAIGHIFRVESNDGTLEAEAWINLERAKALGGKAVNMAEAALNGDDFGVETSFNVRTHQDTSSPSKRLSIDHIGAYLPNNGSLGNAASAHNQPSPSVSDPMTNSDTTDPADSFPALSANERAAELDEQSDTDAGDDRHWTDCVGVAPARQRQVARQLAANEAAGSSEADEPTESTESVDANKADLIGEIVENSDDYDRDLLTDTPLSVVETIHGNVISDGCGCGCGGESKSSFAAQVETEASVSSNDAADSFPALSASERLEEMGGDD